MIDRPVTIPEPFWTAMYADDQQEVHRLTEAGMLLLPSGSRWICPGHHGDGSDFDLYCPGDPKEAFELIARFDWTPPENGTPADLVQKASKADGSISLYRGSLNLIMFFRPESFVLFKDATDLCRSICVTKREDRVRIFRAVCREN